MRVLLVACVVIAAAVGAAQPGAGTGGTVVAFWRETPWPSIWAVRPDGSQLHRILGNRQNAKRPRLSPDRRWVAFDGSPPGKAPLSDFDIQLVRLDGSGRRTLTRSQLWDTDAQWSPDGKLLSFTRTHRSEWQHAWIWTIRPDGTGLRRLARGQFGRWSPDGSRVVLDAPTRDSAGDLFVVDVATGKRRLLLGSPELDQPAAWSPDGRRILFTRFTDDSGRRTDVYVVDADGGGLRRLGPGIAAGWSPDGSKILYADGYPGPISVMNRDGSKRRAIPNAVGADPSWR